MKKIKLYQVILFIIALMFFGYIVLINPTRVRNNFFNNSINGRIEYLSPYKGGFLIRFYTKKGFVSMPLNDKQESMLLKGDSISKSEKSQIILVYRKTKDEEYNLLYTFDSEN